MFLLYYFQSSWRGIHIRLKAYAPASSLATTIVYLVRRQYLAPCDWFLALLDLFESFYVCYMHAYFQMNSFHSGIVYFFYMVLYRFIAGSHSKLQNSSENGIYLFWAIWPARAFKECIFLESDFSAFLIYEILRYIFWRFGLYFSLFLLFEKNHTQNLF